MASSDEARAVEEVARIRDAYERAEEAGEFSPVAPHVADDLVVMMPGREPIEGRTAWTETFDELMADAPDRDYQISYSSTETVVNGDLAFDRGTAHDSMDGDHEGPAQRRYSYLWMFARSADDSWELTHLIWNQDG